MIGDLDIVQNRSTPAGIAAHLRLCNADFVPPLSDRVDVDAYSEKLIENAARFEAFASTELVGLVAAYCNDASRQVAYVSNVSVLRRWQGKGVARELMRKCVQHARNLGFARIELQVDVDNVDAIRLYARVGFRRMGKNGQFALMRLELEGNEPMEANRDYNREIRDNADRQYAYSFDFDVMHPFMIRSFEPFFRQGSLLELGSFKGDFTRRFLDRFDDITCVEASGEAIVEAKVKLGDAVEFVHARFEEVVLPRRYDNIILTHVLEHLDDPVEVLRRINKEWLEDGGRLFLVCPNANAPSRQIAVKMGLISHNAAVTKAEADHGHRCTYSLDTLERDAVAAGLKVVHRSGVFFKALANFQWDRLLTTDIISREYLDGCFKLGQQYPDLCSSIFLLCERGDMAETLRL